MLITKGSFDPDHQEIVLNKLFQARITNQMPSAQCSDWYAALLNLEHYLSQLK